MKWLVWVALGLGGCDSVFGCGAPGEVQYNCQPIADGSPGCVGGPTYRDDDGHDVTVDPDKTFPVHCIAKLPVCDQFHSGAETSVCDMQGATSVGWGILR